MGFIRGSGFVIMSVLFFVALLVMNSTWVISSSLDYDNIKQEFVPVVKEALKENINITSAIELDEYPQIRKYCENLSQTGEYSFDVENYSFSVPCSSLSSGTEAVIDSAIDDFAYKQYYREYNCDFWNCFDKQTLPTFVISQHSKDYWQGKFYLSLLAVLILLALMFVFIEKKTNLLLVAGSLIILSSLAFAKLEAFLAWLINLLLTSPINLDDFLKFFTLVFAQSSKIFLTMLILGIAVLALGIIAKFFSIGFKINEFFSKFDSKKEKELAENREPPKKDKNAFSGKGSK